MDFVIKAAKDTPGVGRYDNTNYDEKYSKPPKGGQSDKTDKYNFFDECKYISKISPKQHDSIDLGKIKRKSYVFTIKAESEMEKKMKQKKWERKNDLHL